MSYTRPYTGITKASESSALVTKPNPVSIRTSLEIINQLPNGISVGFRNGLRMKVAQDFKMGKPVILIREILEYEEGVKVDSSDLSHDLASARSYPNSSILLGSLSKTTGASWDQQIRRARRTEITHVITKEELEQAGGQIYFLNLDLMIGLVETEDLQPHPGSMQGQLAYAEQTDRSGMKMFIEMEINDPDNQFGRRFVNMGGEVLAVPVISDPDRISGVYRTVSVNGNQRLPTTSRTQYLSFEDAEKSLSLFHSFEEARSLGDPAGQMKREYDEMVAANRVKELELRSEVRKIEERVKSRERELEDELRHLRSVKSIHEERASLERMLLKDKLEARSVARREWSDMIKYVPLAIGGIAALYGAYVKYFKSDD